MTPAAAFAIVPDRSLNEYVIVCERIEFAADIVRVAAVPIVSAGIVSVEAVDCAATE